MFIAPSLPIVLSLTMVCDFRVLSDSLCPKCDIDYSGFLLIALPICHKNYSINRNKHFFLKHLMYSMFKWDILFSRVKVKCRFLCLSVVEE